MLGIGNKTQKKADRKQDWGRTQRATLRNDNTSL